MRLVKRKPVEDLAMDMTPMIDMTFQLITFFMMLVNFSQNEQDARVNLPSSALAKPTEETKEEKITLQFTQQGTVLIAGDEVPVGPSLAAIISRERRSLKKPSDVVIIVRADRSIAIGKVQEAIDICQKESFERFRLRVLTDDKG